MRSGGHDPQKIQNMRKHRESLKSDVASLKKSQKKLEETLTRKEGEIISLDREIARLEAQREEPVVTEHATLRWLERVHGIDVASIKQEILTEEFRKQLETIPSGKFKRNGVTIVVKNREVVTVVDPAQ